MRVPYYFVLLGSLVLPLSGCKTTADSEVKEAPIGDSNPSWFGLSTHKYDALPAEAKLSSMPWPGYYWATMKGGIASRWQDNILSGDYKKHLFRIPSQQKYKTMTEAKIAKLSPAEKYDLWVNRTNMNSVTSATGKERAFVLASARFNRESFNKDDIPSWTGICNGWSLAAINEPSPNKPVTVTNAAGQKITFYEGDIKALISQIYFDYQANIIVNRLGSACRDEAVTDANGRVNLDCRDVNPMSFHLVLAGFLAKDKPFVFDVEASDEIWNQPVYGYSGLKFTNLRPFDSGYPNAAAGTKQLVDVEVNLEYIVESHPYKEAIPATDLERYVQAKNYRYTLELDAQGIVLGGEWLSAEKPDFIWKPSRLPDDQIMGAAYPLKYSLVKQLVEQSK